MNIMLHPFCRYPGSLGLLLAIAVVERAGQDTGPVKVVVKDGKVIVGEPDAPPRSDASASCRNSAVPITWLDRGLRRITCSAQGQRLGFDQGR